MNTIPDGCKSAILAERAKSRHLFITVEGLSGSGKTTVATMLANRLGGIYYKTPPETFLPIRDSIEARASPLARHLFYYAGIAQASVEISELLSRQPVVCDKYFATMVAYSRALGIEVEVPPKYDITLPDHAFVLNVPNAVRHRRIAGRGSISAEHRAFLKMEIDCDVLTQFSALDLRVIDNAQCCIDIVFESILRIIKSDTLASNNASQYSVHREGNAEARRTQNIRIR